MDSPADSQRQSFDLFDDCKSSYHGAIRNGADNNQSASRPPFAYLFHRRLLSADEDIWKFRNSGTKAKASAKKEALMEEVW